MCHNNIPVVLLYPFWTWQTSWVLDLNSSDRDVEEHQSQSWEPLSKYISLDSAQQHNIRCYVIKYWKFSFSPFMQLTCSTRLYIFYRLQPHYLIWTSCCLEYWIQRVKGGPGIDVCGGVCVGRGGVQTEMVRGLEINCSYSDWEKKQGNGKRQRKRLSNGGKPADNW